MLTNNTFPQASNLVEPWDSVNGTAKLHGKNMYSEWWTSETIDKMKLQQTH